MVLNGIKNRPRNFPFPFFPDFAFSNSSANSKWISKKSIKVQGSFPFSLPSNSANFAGLFPIPPVLFSSLTSKLPTFNG